MVLYLTSNLPEKKPQQTLSTYQWSLQPSLKDVFDGEVDRARHSQVLHDGIQRHVGKHLQHLSGLQTRCTVE